MYLFAFSKIKKFLLPIFVIGFIILGTKTTFAAQFQQTISTDQFLIKGSPYWGYFHYSTGGFNSDSFTSITLKLKNVGPKILYTKLNVAGTSSGSAVSGCVALNIQYPY